MKILFTIVPISCTDVAGVVYSDFLVPVPVLLNSPFPCIRMAPSQTIHESSG